MSALEPAPASALTGLPELVNNFRHHYPEHTDSLYFAGIK